MIPNHSGLGAAVMAAGRIDEADAALADALRIAAKLEKPTPDVSAAYGHRAALWEARGDLRRAEADARKALEIDLALRGGDKSLTVVRDLDALARILLRKGATEEAESLGARAEAALAALPPRNPIHAVVPRQRAAAGPAAGGGCAGGARAHVRRARHPRPAHRTPLANRASLKAIVSFRKTTARPPDH
jgi:tetratricopeptide (TPR) repeat protein